MNQAPKTKETYDAIISDLDIKENTNKWGIRRLRWAMNRWLKTDGERRRLLQRKTAIEKELEELKEKL